MIKIPSYLNNTIYIAHGGPTGVIAALSARNILDEIRAHSNDPRFQFWNLHVAIDPIQDVPPDEESRIIELLDVVVNEGQLYVFEFGDDQNKARVKRPSTKKPLSAQMLQDYTMKVLRMNYVVK